MEIRESWSPPSKELARLGEKIEWINKDDFICFHCAQKQGQANRKEEESSMYLQLHRVEAPKGNENCSSDQRNKFYFFFLGGWGEGCDM